MSANSITVNEAGTEGEDITISETGYTFGNVNFTVTPLTYTQYQTITGRDLDELFPQLPPEASGVTMLQRCSVYSKYISASHYITLLSPYLLLYFSPFLILSHMT